MTNRTLKWEQQHTALIPGMLWELIASYSSPKVSASESHPDFLFESPNAPVHILTLDQLNQNVWEKGLKSEDFLKTSQAVLMCTQGGKPSILAYIFHF